MRIAAYAALFLLTACATPSPAPQPAPRSNPPAYTADFANFSVGLACTQDVPPSCHGEAEWLTLDRPGSEGQACTLPSPNPCWETEGVSLLLHTGQPGYPLFTRQTFDKSQRLTLEADISAECLSQACYAGPVIYNGEMNYRALYWSWAPNGVQIYIYSPTVTYPINGVFPPGTKLTLGITYDAGTWIYSINRVPVFTEPTGYSQDASELSDNPHLSVFIGDATASLTRLELFYGPR